MRDSISNPTVILAVYCTLVLLASLAGGWMLLGAHLTHGRLQVAVSCVAGLMLGMALLHFIPHAYFQVHSLDSTVRWTLGGFLAMFFLQRFFHYHHHDVPEGAPEHPTRPHAHSHTNEHGDAHCDHHTLAEESARQLSWVGTVIGLSLHSLLDGIALGAAVAAESHEHAGVMGLGAAMAIILHKPFDAMAISTLMTASGSSLARRSLLNWLFALVSPLGVLLFYFGAAHLAGDGSVFVGCALAFCAGTFLCIAATDLLPELQFHSHDRLRLSLALAAGLGMSILIGQFETSGHDGHPHEPAPGAADHDSH